MNELKRSQIQRHIDYVFNECRICAEHHNYSCGECPKEEVCKQVYEYLKRALEPQTESSEEHVSVFPGIGAVKVAKGEKS